MKRSVAHPVAFESGPVTAVGFPTIAFQDDHLLWPQKVDSIAPDRNLEGWLREPVPLQQRHHPQLEHAVSGSMITFPTDDHGANRLDPGTSLRGILGQMPKQRPWMQPPGDDEFLEDGPGDRRLPGRHVDYGPYRIGQRYARADIAVQRPAGAGTMDDHTVRTRVSVRGDDDVDDVGGDVGTPEARRCGARSQRLIATGDDRSTRPLLERLGRVDEPRHSTVNPSERPHRVRVLPNRPRHRRRYEVVTHDESVGAGQLTEEVEVHASDVCRPPRSLARWEV